MSGRALIAIVVLAAPVAAAPAQRRSGTVTYATQQRLYLDAGTRQGLVAGQTLQLHRGGRAAASCKLEQVSDDHATCIGPGRAGDSFALAPPPAPAAPRRLPAPPSRATLEKRRVALADATFEKVPFREAPDAWQGARRASVAVRHLAFAATGALPWQQERADVALTGFRVGGGMQLDVDLSARRWSRRSDPVSFRADDPAQLYVWQASLSRRLAAGGAAFAVGRVRPWGTPGQVILDGAQVGWRTAGGSEAGLFGGGVPDAVTLAPSTSRGTFGAYWAGQHGGEPDSVLRFFRHEARVAVVNTAELGKRLEGEGLLQASITRAFDGAVSFRFAGGDHRAPDALDAVRVDGTLRPADTLSLSGSFRYEALSVPELDGPGVIGTGGAARHADASIAWEPWTELRVSVLAGLSSDLVTSLTRRWVGPELALPQLANGWVGVSAGYFEEDGWAPGRSAWLQVILRSHRAFRLLTRISWYRTRNVAPVDLDELSAALAVEAQLGAHVAVRLSGLARSTLNGETALTGGNTGQAGVFDASLAGTF